MGGWASNVPSFEACRRFASAPHSRGRLAEGIAANRLISLALQRGTNSGDMDGLINSKKAARGRSAPTIAPGGLSARGGRLVVPAPAFLPLVSTLPG